MQHLSDIFNILYMPDIVVLETKDICGPEIKLPHCSVIYYCTVKLFSRQLETFLECSLC